MAKMLEHNCIRADCENIYKDSEIDDYYCPSCLKEKKEIALKLDAKFKKRTVVSKPYDEIERWKREGGFMPIIR